MVAPTLVIHDVATSNTKGALHDPASQHALDAIEVARSPAIPAREDKILCGIEGSEVVG